MNKNEWVARLRASDAIAFVPPVTPLAKDKNKYFGYLLLNSVKGFTSFDDLKVGHGTYEEACIAFGLVGSDEEYVRCVKTLARMAFILLPETLDDGISSLYYRTLQKPLHMILLFK